MQHICQDQEGMVAGFSVRAILGFLNTDDQNGLQGSLVEQAN